MCIYCQKSQIERLAFFGEFLISAPRLLINSRVTNGKCPVGDPLLFYAFPQTVIFLIRNKAVGSCKISRMPDKKDLLVTGLMQNTWKRTELGSGTEVVSFIEAASQMQRCHIEPRHSSEHRCGCRE